MYYIFLHFHCYFALSMECIQFVNFFSALLQTGKINAIALSNIGVFLQFGQQLLLANGSSE